MTSVSTLESRTASARDGSNRAPAALRPSARSTRLPVGRDLSIAHRLSIAIAVLVGSVSAAGLVFGPTGLYGTDPGLADGIVTSTAGIVIPGFRAHDLFDLAVALPLLLATLWAARRGSLVGLLLWPGALFYVLYTLYIGGVFGHRSGARHVGEADRCSLGRL